MSIQKTIGGDRLGAGKKNKVSLHGYERSTHNLGYIWRSTMAAGTLVPFLTEVALPGDTFDIDLDVDVKTHPTIGPLFGSFKIQLDVFQTPVRLYQGALHNNKLGIGMNMKNVSLPQILLQSNWDRYAEDFDNQQINPSSIFSYLNIRGIGRTGLTSSGVVRQFNAIPYLAYWDIYKNYYANKQEEVGYYIHSDVNVIQPTGIQVYGPGTANQRISIPAPGDEAGVVTINSGITMSLITSTKDINKDWIMFETSEGVLSANDIMADWKWDVTEWTGSNLRFKELSIYVTRMPTKQELLNGEPTLQSFPLTNIDQMREDILAQASYGTMVLDLNAPAPYGPPMGYHPNNQYESKQFSQEGLGIKTYQSDLFNNWMSTEWIDGGNGINEITSIDTSEGSFNLDTLNLSKKVYDMLNRIAISGGSYDDWMDAVYTHDRYRRAESPMYMGGLSRELVFQEVVSNTQSADGQPLGTLAGRGAMGGRKKGGKISIRVDEPSYIMGIISLTPRLDYSQGNKWDVNLKTMDDFHKPALDEIGFQDLITDQMAWWDTVVNNGSGMEQGPVFKSAGKQPAWINYMTNVNQVRGNFAMQNNEMFMTLNRRYEPGDLGDIRDLTTYIDPVKFNHIFAETSRDAQNFWTQIAVDITARRKMSAKIMPNL